MRALFLSIAVFLQAGFSMAGAYQTSIAREPLNIGIPSDRLTVGLTYEDIKLGVDFDNGPDAILDAASWDVYIGYDVLPWLTVFTTLGSSEIDDADEIDTSAKFKISGGANAYLWEGDVLEPNYMAGRFTLKATFELSRYDSESDVGDVSWIDATFAIPLGYEIFDDYTESTKGINTSVALYIGPAISYVNGTWESLNDDLDFEGKELLGLIGGVDLFLSPTLSMGVAFRHFDETSVAGSLRFHL